MKIGFDGKRAVQNRTGLGNYSRFVVDILSQYFSHRNEYVLYAPAKRENPNLEKLLARKQVSIRYPQSKWNRTFRSLWRVWSICRDIQKDRIELFHGLSNELPLSIRQCSIKSIVTIHDLIFIRYPQYYPYIDRQIYKYKFRKACENSDHIIAISETTKQDIIRFFGIREEKISVVYQGCDPVFKRPASEALKEEIRRKYRLPEKYILNVGSIESRKNLLLIVKALVNLPSDVCLVAIGKRTPYTETVEKFIATHGLENRVQILTQIPFRELPAFYQMASVFVYPSRFEGFGIPILEAICSRVPVIAATGSCLEEAGGPACRYVHPDDAEGLANQVEQILSSPTLRQEMVQESLTYAQRFADEAIARDLMKVYKKIMTPIPRHTV